ncbi:MAG: hypothetical protein Q8Q14_01760 [Gemmatimonadales bacterium]|nr:hypothetical protein [Gemmatimonadales bacterium]
MRRSLSALAALALFAGALAAQQVYTHELVTFSFPKGWAAQPPPAAEAGIITSFGAAALGASGVVLGGAYGNMKETLQQGRGQVIAGLPGAIPDTLVHEFKTLAGDNVMMQSFTGTIAYAGKDVELGALVAVTVKGDRGVIMQVYFPPANADRVAREFVELVRSIK